MVLLLGTINLDRTFSNELERYLKEGKTMSIETVIAILCSSSFSSLVIYFMNRRDKKKEKEENFNSAQTKMILALGHDRMIHIMDQYIERGYITLKEKRNLRYLYEPYRALGGNGDCEIGYAACEKLKVVSSDNE